ncbi:hypothetical protein ASG73_15575 [Janibacter sp. Soil728]|uniref:hypothetical protein n=1 Tax=Janibacter sp. Soil728 TaxID=1736393 RepID=UPI0007004BD6|nr:hypothetical protein [Janibacter sp. Soil728]KRE36072.1 hypothetical protein ASG73_15575 [Janibacter sp. Soil728]
MSKPKVTGVSMWGLDWEYVASNKDLARRVLVFLEDRRVITDHPDREDFDSTRESADQIRKFLTLEIMNVKAGGELERALKAIRTASRAFVDAAGQDSKLFKSDHRYFKMTLVAYREVVARQVAAISVNFKLPITDELAQLLAEHDLSSHQT